MRSAFRRELSRTGFQILGLLLGLLLVLALGAFYGHRIENEVGEVNDRQRSDHRHIVAIEKGHPLNDSMTFTKPHAGGDAQTPTHSGQQPGPPSHGGHPGGHVGGQGGTPEPSPAPTPSPTPAPSPQPPVTESANPSRGPLAPVVEEVVPPVAAPAVQGVCETASAAVPVC